jgi:hypothetical protein
MQVGQQAGHRGMHMPGRLHFGGYQVDVLETLDQWYGTDCRISRSGAMMEASTSFASMNLAPNGS